MYIKEIADDEFIAVMQSIRRVTASTVYALATDRTLECDCSINNMAVHLLASSAVRGQIIAVKKIAGDENNLTIVPEEDDTIEGQEGSYSVPYVGDCIFLQAKSDGSGWIRLV